MKISIADKFSRYPYGRYRTDGKYSGEKFRDEILIPAYHALSPGEKLEVSLDGVKILAPSFLEEAFGGMVRILIKNKIPFDLIKKTVIITAESSKYDNSIQKTNSYMEDAAS